MQERPRVEIYTEKMTGACGVARLPMFDSVNTHVRLCINALWRPHLGTDAEPMHALATDRRTQILVFS